MKLNFSLKDCNTTYAFKTFAEEIKKQVNNWCQFCD